MPRNPLAEVFGFPVDNFSEHAERNRAEKFCPFNNSTGPKCTKNSIRDPLGVCSIFAEDKATITCPIRFRQDWRIAADAADFFFQGLPYTSFIDIDIHGAYQEWTETLDVVLAAFDDFGRIIDFGVIIVQESIVNHTLSGNYAQLVKDPEYTRSKFWPHGGQPYIDNRATLWDGLLEKLSLISPVLNNWQVKLAVAMQEGFYNSGIPLPITSLQDADAMCMVYDLQYRNSKNCFDLIKTGAHYSKLPSHNHVPSTSHCNNATLSKETFILMLEQIAEAAILE